MENNLDIFTSLARKVGLSKGMVDYVIDKVEKDGIDINTQDGIDDAIRKYGKTILPKMDIIEPLAKKQDKLIEKWTGKSSKELLDYFYKTIENVEEPPMGFNREQRREYQKKVSNKYPRW